MKSVKVICVALCLLHGMSYANRSLSRSERVRMIMARRARLEQLRRQKGVTPDYVGVVPVQRRLVRGRSAQPITQRSVRQERGTMQAAQRAQQTVPLAAKQRRRFSAGSMPRLSGAQRAKWEEMQTRRRFHRRFSTGSMPQRSEVYRPTEATSF